MSEATNLVELVELLLSIDENDPGNEQNAYIFYDKDDNKMIL
jgi:hypothetical protein